MLSRTIWVLTASTLLSLASLACTPEPSAPTKVEAEASEAEPAAGQPKIASDEATFDFGKIAPKQTIEHVFTIKNVGDADLEIDRVQKT